MFNRKPSEIQQRKNGTGMGVYSSTSEFAVSDFEILVAIIFVALLLDLAFWG
jgi:hypothetical protein